MIIPICTYASEVWGPYIFKGTFEQIVRNMSTDIEKLHTRMSKNALGMKRHASNAACRMELGRFPICINIISNIYKYFLALQNSDHGKLSKQALHVQKVLYMSGQRSVVTFVERILAPVGHTPFERI